jgi:predicted O-methyltransferase YrrM
MNFEQLDNLKGFMPSHEGLALTKWAEEVSCHGPALEIGTFGAKSALYIAAGSSIHSQLVYTVDHHSGSENTSSVKSILIQKFMMKNWAELIRCP